MGLAVPWLAGSELKEKLIVFPNGRLAAMLLCSTGMLPCSPGLAQSLRPGLPPPIDVVFVSRGESVDNRTVNCLGRIPFMIACAGRSVGISSLFGSTIQLGASALHCSEQVRSKYNCQTGQHLPDRLIFNRTFYKP